MFEKSKKPKTTGSPTQAFLKIAEIRQDTVIMADGTLRAVLAVSSTNFDLKSQEEQNALIYNYQRFLNSLEYPLQILMQSRKMDISGYLESLKVIVSKQTNELLRMQTSEYIDFIDRLVESANVMNKNFYVVVQYNQSIAPVAGGFFSKLLQGAQVRQISEREENFSKHRVQLDERTVSVASNLSSIGLRVVRLNTDQLIELMYNSYNFSVGPAIDASQLDQVTITEEAV
jgi:type IV secretory pathway VirB4 component